MARHCVRKCWFFKQRSQKSRSKPGLVEDCNAVAGLPLGGSAVANDFVDFVSGVVGTSAMSPFSKFVSWVCHIVDGESSYLVEEVCRLARVAFKFAYTSLLGILSPSPTVEAVYSRWYQRWHVLKR